MRHLPFLLLAALLIAGCSDTSQGADPSSTDTDSGTDSSPSLSSSPPVSKGPSNRTVFDDSVPVAISGTAPREFFVPRGSIRLQATVAMNASSSGPYLLYGEGEAGAPPKLMFTQGGQPRASFSFDAAASMAPGPETIQGPQAIAIDDPSPGGWAIEFGMGASNVRAVVLVTVEVVG